MKSNLVHFSLKSRHLVATILMSFWRINQTLSFWTAHSASWTAQNWLDCMVRISLSITVHLLWVLTSDMAANVTVMSCLFLVIS